MIGRILARGRQDTSRGRQDTDKRQQNTVKRRAEYSGVRQDIDER